VGVVVGVVTDHAICVSPGVLGLRGDVPGGSGDEPLRTRWSARPGRARPGSAPFRAGPRSVLGPGPSGSLAVRGALAARGGRPGGPAIGRLARGGERAVDPI